ncbi:NAD(P)-binding protein [Serendipita vermifera]|nr:NAD(P)-binding protein [Serendipita vermifera]
MSKILVTGGNGFVAAQVLIAALNKGYQVVATVRNEEKGTQTKTALEKKVGSNISNLSFAIVPSVEAEGAFDEVLKAHEFTAVLHTATPFHLHAADPNEIVGPAVGGTKSILKSIKNLAPTVKRVIITSSFASIVSLNQGFRPTYAYTEEDWNPVTWEETIGGDPVLAYYGAKKWAERAAWDFVKEEKPQFELVVLCPPMVFGEVAQYTESVDKLNTSSAGLYAILTGQNKEIETQSIMIFCNVIDLAVAHIRAIEAPDAGNKRILTCSDKPYNPKQISDAFIKHFPDLARNTPTKLPEGVEADGYPTGGYYRGDNSLSKKILGMTYYDIEETMVQFVNSVKDLPKSA